MSKNSSQGATRLANVLQARMKSVKNNENHVSAELGLIDSNGWLRVDSLSGIAFTRDDYSVCNRYNPSNGDRVLVIWTEDDEPVVIDKIS